MVKNLIKLFTFTFFTFLFQKISAQIFIPFSFWKPTATLTISDATTFDYGNVAVNTNQDYAFTLTNSFQGTVSNIAGAAFSGTRYTFKGGSFPGTGGTCTTTLAASASCTFVVTANSSTTGVFNDTITLTYSNGANTAATATRAVTANFINTPTQLAWISTPAFIKVNDCVAVTVQTQDSSGNPLNVGSNTTINLVINNATNTNFYTSNTCGTTATTRTITTGTNSVTFYVRSTTPSQTAILVATATGVTSASQDVNITDTPTKLLVLSPPRAKVNTCVALTIYTTDVNGLYATAGSTVTVNMTTSGANIYYSNSGCSSSITSTTIAANTYSKTIYTQDATIQSVTITATDNAAVLASSNDTTNFATSLTWWDVNYANRIRIDINNLDQATTFTNQPVLLELDSTIITYSQLKAAGADVRFVASDDVTQIDHEIELWNTSGTSFVWTRVPSITASSATTYIYMYYNYPSAVDGQNKTGVWTNYWSVWHLGENPSATAPQYLDSTSGARNGTAVNSPTRVSGPIGYAANLSGTNDSIDINSNLSVVLGATSTFSCWMRTSQTGNNTNWLAPGLTGVEQAGGQNDIFWGWIDGSGNIGVTAGDGANAKSNYVVNNNAWRHVSITRNATSGVVNFYINGVLQNTATSDTGNKTTYFDLLGEIGDTGGSPENFNGQMDEVRIVSSVFSAAQIRADFKYMSNTHVVYNSPETYP